jgi:hypothetical protein
LQGYLYLSFHHYYFNSSDGWGEEEDPEDRQAQTTSSLVLAHLMHFASSAAAPSLQDTATMAYHALPLSPPLEPARGAEGEEEGTDTHTHTQCYHQEKQLYDALQAQATFTHTHSNNSAPDYLQQISLTCPLSILDKHTQMHTRRKDEKVRVASVCVYMYKLLHAAVFLFTLTDTHTHTHTHINRW